MQPTPSASYSLTLRVAIRVARSTAAARNYPNQINNVLCFPGIITDVKLHPEYIVPSVFDKRVAEAVANEVEAAAYKTGVARRERFPES